MKILIDTHVAIWSVLDDPKLSETARDILLNKENTIYYSSASVWEITIKHMAHPETFLYSGYYLAKGCDENGFLALPVLNQHSFALETLRRSENAPRHNDPFDRIMLAQAKAEGMQFLTHDSLLPYYNEPFIISV